MPGDEALPESEGGGTPRASTGPRHAVPRKSLLTRVHVPAGKAIALAAMPTAVLMGMGLTPRLAQAAEPKSTFTGDHCVSQSDSPSPSASPSVSPSASPSASASPSPSAKRAHKGGPSAEPSTKAGRSAGPSASPKPSPSASTAHPSDLGGVLGGLLGGLIGSGSGSSGAGHGPTATPTPSAKPTPSASHTADGGALGSVVRTVHGVTQSVTGATKGVTGTVGKAVGAATGPSSPASGQPYPCPTYNAKALADAGLEQTPSLLPDQPWVLKSSMLTLTGLQYHGIVKVRTEDGNVKNVLKFTASGVDIKDLHQIVQALDGSHQNVQAAAGSTSTIRNGTVTMYTQELKGNLLGLIPIDFTPDSPPPLTIPTIFFTNVTVTQAGQFGGTLTVPGMHAYGSP